MNRIVHSRKTSADLLCYDDEMCESWDILIWRELKRVSVASYTSLHNVAVEMFVEFHNPNADRHRQGVF